MGITPVLVVLSIGILGHSGESYRLKRFDPLASNLTNPTVSVYYETLCGDSQRFILYDLAPIWEKYNGRVNLEFIPFGKAHSVEDFGFSCQHGPNECKGNMIDSCVLNKITPGRNQLSYVACRMSDAADDSHVQYCADAAGVHWRAVEYCTTSMEGKMLQLQAEKDTKMYTPGPRFVPTIVFNKKYNDNYQNAAIRGGLEKILCEEFQVC